MNLNERLLSEAASRQRFRLSYAQIAPVRARVLDVVESIGRLRAAETDPGLRRLVWGSLPEEARLQIEHQRPRTIPEANWPTIRAFVQDSVAAAAPQTAYSAQVLFTYTAAFVNWCVFVEGLPLQVHAIWSRQVINLYVMRENWYTSDGARRNCRAMLTRIAEVLKPDEHPKKFTPLASKHSVEPYTPEEMDEFRAWARSLNTPLRRRRAAIMLSLCAGAGLRPAEIGALYPENIWVSADCVIINVVSGRTPRKVPVAVEWESWVRHIAAESLPNTPIWGAEGVSQNSGMLSSFTNHLTGVVPRGDRLRTTWMLRLLEKPILLKAFSEAAGVRKFEMLPLLLDRLSPVEEADYVATLRQGASHD